MEHKARQRRESFDKYDYASEESLALTPISAWRGLTDDERRAAEIVKEIEHDARGKRERSGATVLGAAKILHQDPHAKPARPARSPAPRFHARTREARRRLEHA